MLIEAYKNSFSRKFKGTISWAIMWVGLHPGGLVSRLVFLLAGTWAYIQGLIKEGGGGICTFCEHFESAYMLAALRSYSTKRDISLHFFESV